MDFIYSLWKAAAPSQSEEGVYPILSFHCLPFFMQICLNIWFLFKVGHAGTLDPMATGLLIVCVGKATKVVDR